MNLKKPRRLVAQAVAEQLAPLLPTERADLDEGIEHLLAEAARWELARHTSGLIRQAE